MWLKNAIREAVKEIRAKDVFVGPRDDLKAPKGKFRVVHFSKLGEVLWKKVISSYAEAISSANGISREFRGAKVIIYDDHGNPTYNAIHF